MKKLIITALFFVLASSGFAFVKIASAAVTTPTSVVTPKPVSAPVVKPTLVSGAILSTSKIKSTHVRAVRPRPTSVLKMTPAPVPVKKFVPVPRSATPKQLKLPTVR